MKPGDRVTTPEGDGTIVHFRTQERWTTTARRPDRITWILIRIDGRTPKYFLTSNVELHEQHLTEFPDG